MAYRRTPAIQERLQAREAAIIEAATRVFTGEGYHGTTMKAIAREAGVATGTVYLYFPSKEAIFASLIERLRGMVLEAIVSARARCSTTLSKLAASIPAAIQVFAHNRDLARIVLIQAPGASPAFEARLAEIHDLFAGFVRQELAEAQGRGELPPIDPEVAARAWVGTFYEVIMTWLRSVEADRDSNPARLLLQTIPALVKYNLAAVGAPDHAPRDPAGAASG